MRAKTFPAKGRRLRSEGGAKRLAINPPEYLAWRDMIRRCHDARDKDYRYYGGRGIVVREEWRGSYKQFLADVGCKPEPKREYVLVRLNVDGNYEAGNVEWRLQGRQASNRRSARMVKVGEEVLTFSSASKQVGLNKKTLTYRVRQGMAPEVAIGKPVAPHAPKRCGMLAGHTLECADVASIKRLFASGDWTKKALGERFGVTPATIRRIVNGQAWKKVGRYA